MSDGQSEQAPAPEGVPAVGEVLAGKYRVERVLGVGGMGAVVAAMHLQLGERVALKFLLPSMATDETIERFAREARAAARIKSEHIARVTDVGTLETGAPYMVMEFLEGSDLSAVLKEQGPPPVRDAVEYVIQAADAVAEAHAIGIVHRDLKPANLFLARRPGAPARVKVLDFGISKVVAPDEQQGPLEQRTVTRTRAWLGSPLYMAPE
ncbi:MAG TPA: serine/threonine-protein kinase, partial [Minicystis sp.]|nr:serine/threonine-protein kinase [Minicystis sp.]